MIVFPVGHYLGEHHPEGKHLVRIGMRHHELTADQFGVWVLGHGADRPEPWTVQEIVELAEASGVPDVLAHIEDLTSRGLLTEVPPSSRTFAESHRLAPLLVGLGNTEEDPDHYALGFPALDQPVAVVPVGSYELWQWGHIAPSLWHTCEIRAKVAADLSQPEGDVLEGVLADLRPLLVHGCAYLDVVY